MSKIKKDKRTEVNKEKEKYRLLNWKEYNQSLVNRGNITLYFDEAVLDQWYDDGPAQRGAQYEYSDLCIETLLMLKVVFKLGYRQTEGFAKGLLKLMCQDEFRVPSYSQIQRRSQSIEIPGYRIPKSSLITLVIDSTGLKIYGEGEWKVRKHGVSKRRTWRKLHLGCDPRTGFIHCHVLTDNATDDASQLEPMLDQVEEQVDEVCVDGAYDHQDCWDCLIENNIEPIIPPRSNAVKWYEQQPGDLPDYPRNVAIDQIQQMGRKQWKRYSGYHQRSLAETAMYRFKTIHGSSLYSRKMETQKAETRIKIKALNMMTALGMPDSIKRKTA